MCLMAPMISRPTRVVSGVPSMVTMPSLTVTVNRSGSHRNVPRIRSLVTWRWISASGRLYTLSTSARVTMPISLPLSLMTGSRLTRRSNIRRAARVTGSSGPMVTGGLVIRSAAVSAFTCLPHALLPAQQRPGHGALERLLGQQVGLGDDPDDLVVVVEHGERADPLLVQHGRHLLVRGALA